MDQQRNYNDAQNVNWADIIGLRQQGYQVDLSGYGAQNAFGAGNHGSAQTQFAALRNMNLDNLAMALNAPAPVRRYRGSKYASTILAATALDC